MVLTRFGSLAGCPRELRDGVGSRVGLDSSLERVVRVKITVVVSGAVVVVAAAEAQPPVSDSIRASLVAQLSDIII